MEQPGGARDSVLAALAGETIARTGRLRFRCAGTSMMPSLRPGDVLEFIPPDGRISCGDIVLWQSMDRLFVHRVVATDDRLIRTRGDSLSHLDPPVPAAEVLGRLEFYERAGRRRPSPRLNAIGHCWGWCLRRSAAATRIVLRWHRLSARLRA